MKQTKGRKTRRRRSAPGPVTLDEDTIERAKSLGPRETGIKSVTVEKKGAKT